MAVASKTLRLGLQLAGSRCHNTAATPGMMEVCAIDPLLILEPERLAAAVAGAKAGDASSVQPSVSVMLPHRLLAQLPTGRLELADHDDPGNHWYFGQQGELFQYKFAGRHSVHSGFTSLILAHELQQLQSTAAAQQRAPRKQAAASERSWLAFLQHIQGSSGEGKWPTPTLPFLFAGKAIDCESVGVYTMGEGSGMVGLMLSTEYETPGAD